MFLCGIHWTFQRHFSNGKRSMVKRFCSLFIIVPSFYLNRISLALAIKCSLLFQTDVCQAERMDFVPLPSFRLVI
jgi:hypothetical protein